MVISVSFLRLHINFAYSSQKFGPTSRSDDALELDPSIFYLSLEPQLPSQVVLSWIYTCFSRANHDEIRILHASPRDFEVRFEKYHINQTHGHANLTRLLVKAIPVVPLVCHPCFQRKKQAVSFRLFQFPWLFLCHLNQALCTFIPYSGTLECTLEPQHIFLWSFYTIDISFGLV